MPIPHSEVFEYYERVRPTRFTTSAKVQFRVIDIKPSELKPSQVDSSVQETRQEAALRIATDLSERAKKGEDFGGLAKLHSHGHQRINGGLWPPVSPDALSPPYDVLGEHARNMQIGQVSKPFQKGGHVFVMRLEQRIPDSIQPFDEVKDSLERELRTLRRKRLEEAIGR
jgi:parvulin-like peptidyl-prolyl isomerase